MHELKDAKSDIILGACMAVFAALFYAETYRFQPVALRNTVDATFVPRVLGVIVLMCSLLLFFQGIRRRRRALAAGEVEEVVGKSSVAGRTRVGLVAVVLFTAACCFERLGFILTMPPMMFALFVIIEKPCRRRWTLYFFSSLLAPVVVFFIFYYGFSTLLPMGVLAPVLARFL